MGETVLCPGLTTGIQVTHTTLTHGQEKAGGRERGRERFVRGQHCSANHSDFWTALLIQGTLDEFGSFCFSRSDRCLIGSFPGTKGWSSLNL